jgi:hypothetical protein
MFSVFQRLGGLQGQGRVSASLYPERRREPLRNGVLGIPEPMALCRPGGSGNKAINFYIACRLRGAICCSNRASKASHETAGE